MGLSPERQELIFVEAKGGSSQLSTTGRLLPDGTRAPQGSTAYLNDIARVDTTFQDWLRANPDVPQGLADGRVTARYQLVHATPGGKVRIFELQLDRATLDIRLVDN
ncbi:hypothetical protein [Cellulomonas xiejunii]|uniref:hypothetical protein n=1 Tax=Cellulomonas xiejunii TaxID=2968083 RepID=UPI001D0E2DA0|nr:hypothetical protein [Cellulomonas xiejunii]MCC2314203.1 hypothetical protein [Cellulomonas xiejunii]